jgi:hypothetical protein
MRTPNSDRSTLQRVLSKDRMGRSESRFEVLVVYTDILERTSDLSPEDTPRSREQFPLEGRLGKSDGAPLAVSRKMRCRSFELSLRATAYPE